MGWKCKGFYWLGHMIQQNSNIIIINQVFCFWILSELPEREMQPRPKHFTLMLSIFSFFAAVLTPLLNGGARSPLVPGQWILDGSLLHIKNIEKVNKHSCCPPHLDETDSPVCFTLFVRQPSRNEHSQLLIHIQWKQWLDLVGVTAVEMTIEDLIAYTNNHHIYKHNSTKK